MDHIKSIYLAFIMLLLSGVYFAVELNMEQKESATFETKFTLSTDAQIQANKPAISMPKEYVISGNSDAITNNDIICPTTVDAKATLKSSWALTHFDAIAATVLDNPGTKEDYSATTQSPVNWITKNDFDLIKSCSSEVFPFSFGDAGKCYNIIASGPRYNQKTTYVGAIYTDPGKESEKKYPNKKGEANIYCTGKIRLKDGATSVAVWDLKNLFGETTKLKLSEGVHSIKVETEGVECVGVLKENGEQFANIYNNKVVKIQNSVNSVDNLIVKQTKMDTEILLFSLSGSFQIPAGGSANVPFLVSNNGNVPITIKDVPGDFGVSGFGFAKAPDPVFINGVQYENAFGKTIQPGESKYVFVKITAPKDLTGDEKIKMYFKVDPVGNICPNTQGVTSEGYALIPLEITADEIPAATSCQLTPASTEGDVGKISKFQLSCKDQSGAKVKCPETKYLKTKTSDPNGANVVDYTSSSVDVMVNGGGTTTITISTKNYPNEDFSCSAVIQGKAGEGSGIPKSCELTPNSVDADIGSTVTYGISCKDETGTIVPCSDPTVMDKKTSNPNVAVVTDYTGSEVKVFVKEPGSSTVTISTNANVFYKYECSANLVSGLKGEPEITFCELLPDPLSGKVGETVTYKLGCTIASGETYKCPPEEFLSFTSGDEKVATFSSYGTDKVNVLLKKEGSTFFMVSSNSQYPNQFNCRADLNSAAAPANQTGNVLCDITPSAINVENGKKNSFNLSCSENGKAVSCPTSSELQFKFSNNNAGLFSYGKDFFQIGKSMITVQGNADGNTLMEVSSPKFSNICTGRVTIDPAVNQTNQTGNSLCSLSPPGINVQKGTRNSFNLACTEDGKTAPCPTASELQFKFSNSNAELFSYGKDFFGMGKSIVTVLGKSDGISIMDVSSSKFSNICTGRIAVGAGITPPSNQTNQTNTTIQFGNACALNPPSIVELDKPFSVGITCFNESNGEKSVVPCNGVDWDVQFSQGGYTLNSENDEEVSLTINKENTVGEVFATVGGKYACKLSDLTVSSNVCILSPSIWVGRPGQSEQFSLRCRVGGVDEECQNVQWAPPANFKKEGIDSNSSKAKITAPIEIDTFVDGENIVVSAVGADSKKKYLCTVKAYIAEMVCKDYV